MRRRVCLSVPATDPRKTAKADDTGADEIVFDLEDSVPPEQKVRARDFVRTAPRELGGASFAVRVNAVGTPWCHEDILACAGASLPGTIIVPKVESGYDLAFIDRLLDGAEAASGTSTPLRVQALIENARGLSQLDEIAAASPRLDSLILGYADLAASLGRTQSASWSAIQDRIIIAARTNNLEAIDGPYLGVAGDEGFRTHVTTAHEAGFDGKWVIHPRQIPLVRQTFTPSDTEIRHAREVLAALATASERGTGAVAVDGQMLDEALAVSARRVLEKAGL